MLSVKYSSSSEKYFAGSADSCRVCRCTNCISNFQMTQAAPPRVRPTIWCFALQLQMQDFLTVEEVCIAFCSTSNDTQQQSLDWKTSLFLTVCRKAVSHIFADICTPLARLQKPLSKDGFPKLEYRLKPLAGHLYCQPMPGKNHDGRQWRQDSQIQAISAACEDSSDS